MTKRLYAIYALTAARTALLTAIFLIAASMPAKAQCVPAQTGLQATDTLTASSGIKNPQTADTVYAKRSDNPDWWWNRLRSHTLEMKDTTVIYPKFMGFCVKVYNWADKTFNSYDTTYVKGTGKRWKAVLRNDNWADSYAFNFRHDMPMRLMGDVYCNLGAYLQYMAVSIGYSLDMSNLIGHKPMLHKKMGFGFSCALFTAEVYYTENTGGSYLRSFGKFNDGKLIKERFPGVFMRTYGIDAYYFLNHKRYSQGAAYSFSKYQVKSAGSFIVGFTYGNRNISLDFSSLPEHLLKYLTIPVEKYQFHYNNYCIMAGYGYNLAFAKNWLYNFTAIPAVGLNQCYDDSLEGKQNMLSLGVKSKMSLTWNISDFFIGIQGAFDGSWYRSSDYSLFSSTENFSASIGIRF